MNENNYNEFRISNLDYESKKTDLLKQELDVNLQLQVIVKKRIELLKDSFLQIPNTAPEYALLLTQQEQDMIELDELKYREGLITELLSKYKSKL
ncbi:MAG: hypothetical protein WCT85_07240 [Parachlamydiales bacterium]|jgi:hypothetical protein